MTPNSLAEFLKLHDESTLRERIRISLPDWASVVMRRSGLSPSAHHRLLLDTLDRVTRGEIKRCMVLMPPGSAKSTYVSIVYPIWWFMQYPGSSIIAASHTASLVEHLSRRIRSLISENRGRIGFGLRTDDRAVARWSTN